MKRSDLILIFSVLGLALFLWGLFGLFKKKGAEAIISIDGVEQYVLPLDTDTSLTISTEYGTNTIYIHDQTVSVTDADCKDRYCVLHRPVSMAGETIVCLPHKLVVTVRSSDSSGRISNESVQIDQVSR